MPSEGDKFALSKSARPKVGFIPLTNTFFAFELAEDAREKALDALGRLDVELVVSADKAIETFLIDDTQLQYINFISEACRTNGNLYNNTLGMRMLWID